MATVQTFTAATGTHKKVSNSLSLLWRAHVAVMHKPTRAGAHPLVRDRQTRTPRFEWNPFARHQRMFG